QHLTDLDGEIDLTKLRYLVVDEADRMKYTAKMEWYNLLEERARVLTPNSTSIDRLLLTNQNRWLQKILVSATLSLDAEKLFIWNLKCPKLFCADSVQAEETKEEKKKVVVDETMDIDKDESEEKKKPKEFKHAETVTLPSTLKHNLIKCKSERKPLDVYCWIQQHPEWKKILIFVNSILASKRLTKLLELMFKDSKKVEQINSGIKNKKRLGLIKKLAENKLDILVCTDNATRGMDVENIDCVINYDVPKDNRTFIHRSGRTARAGKSGIVLTFTNRLEVVDFKKMLAEYGFMEKTEVIEPEDLSSTKDRTRYKKTLEELSKIFGKKEK
uniref:ATP-dependent RNA helicase n=1 Tax=Panagrolaimus sp. JU765 TaxID=591449 RepID=A0AC34QD40_9BILA